MKLNINYEFENNIDINKKYTLAEIKKSAEKIIIVDSDILIPVKTNNKTTEFMVFIETNENKFEYLKNISY